MLIIVAGAIVGLWVGSKLYDAIDDEDFGCVVSVPIMVMLILLGAGLGGAGAAAIGSTETTAKVVQATHHLDQFPNSTPDHPIYLQVWDGKAVYLIDTPDGAQPQTLENLGQLYIRQGTDSSAQLVVTRQQFKDDWFWLVGTIRDDSTSFQFLLPPGGYIMCKGSAVAAVSAACSGN